MGLSLLLAATGASGSYWVSDILDADAQCRVVRTDGAVAIQQLMLLQSGDTIVIDDPRARITIVNEQNEYLTLTIDNTPFVVPESDAAPRLLVNVRNWVASWWNTRGNQSTSTMAAVSKGGLTPQILVAGSRYNLLLSGTRVLQVAWSGGIEPFDVSLTTEAGELLSHRAGVTGNLLRLPEVSLQDGQLRLRVAAGDAASTVGLTVVGREALPAVAAAIMDLEVPDEIQFGHLAMVLSAYGQWRFEALQLADEHGLTQLALELLAGNHPESAPGFEDAMNGVGDPAARPAADTTEHDGQQ